MVRKYSSVLTIFLASTFPASAEDGDPCVAQASLAAQIMEAHQVGVPLTQLMEVLAENELGRIMARAAYSSPRYSSPVVRQQAIDDFRDRMALLCYEAHAND